MTVRVQPVPASHPYARALSGSGAVFLPDPVVAGRPDGQWWPHPALEPAWIDANAARFDLLHLHFGTEHRSAREIEAWLHALDRQGVPLVHTVHDIEHPHLADPTGHDAHLQLLARGAARLATLTAGAAAELRRRYAVDAMVIPHPQLATDDWFLRADDLRSRRTVGHPQIGVHARAGRANLHAPDWLVGIADAARDVDGTLHVFVNDDGSEAPLAALPAVLVEHASVRCHVRPRPDDDALVAELAGLDVAVLPYAHGTHSGWLELCWDLGVRVLAPAVGYLAEQHGDPWFHASIGREGPGAALSALLDAGPVPHAAARLDERRRQRLDIHRAHQAMYGMLVSA